MRYEFKEGGIQHEQFLEIITDYWDNGINRCRHAKPLNQGDKGYVRPRHLDEDEIDDTEPGEQFLTPMVVLAWNQGGHDCTVVCVDCIMEARETIANTNGSK